MFLFSLSHRQQKHHHHGPVGDISGHRTPSPPQPAANTCPIHLWQHADGGVWSDSPGYGRSGPKTPLKSTFDDVDDGWCIRYLQIMMAMVNRWPHHAPAFRLYIYNNQPGRYLASGDGRGARNMPSNHRHHPQLLQPSLRPENSNYGSPTNLTLP